MRKWRPRFSLRTLLILLTVVCVSLGLSFSSARRQQKVVSAIEAAGGRVGYDWQTRSPANGGRSEATPPAPAWLRKLLGRHYFDTVVSVDIAHTLIHNSPDKFAKFGARLAELRGLKHLSLFRLTLSDAEYAMISRLQGLEQLHLGSMEISDDGAEQLSSLTNLRELSLNEVVISAKGVAEFKKLPNLEELSICCRHMDYGPHNEPIWNVEKYALRDNALEAFPEFPRLRKLSLSFTQITDKGVETLSRLPQLETLGLTSPHITNDSMPNLMKLQDLYWLGLEACGVDDDHLAMLQGLPKLTGLRLSGRAITNAGLPNIAKLSRLKRLSLGGKTIDDDGLTHLHRMTNLEMLDVQSTAVKTGGEAVKQLQQALPNCTIITYHPPMGWNSN